MLCVSAKLTLTPLSKVVVAIRRENLTEAGRQNAGTSALLG
jgi:hypothetical protein